MVVTGDLPPLDYIGADGGTLALTSNTTDSVFWYMETPGATDDLPEGLLFSDPYISWDIRLYIRKAVDDN
ncbi:MAG: hypothetical protein Q4F25_04155 [Eubacteriales bacterium]|nr:hypothetical protein [Eubacteriales bacterium]